MFSWAYINHDFIKEENALLTVRDLSIFRGYAVFDFFRFSNFRPQFLSDHIDRLFHSAAALRMHIDQSKEALSEIIQLLIERNEIAEGGIRVTITGGTSASGYLPGKSSLIITQHHFEEVTEAQFVQGIPLVSYEYQRQLPGIKTTDYLMGIYLRPWIENQDAEDVIYVNNGLITECPRANIFIIDTSGKLCTPKSGILEGVTRKNILKLAASHYVVAEKNITLEDLLGAREAFITSTTKKILPVRSVNGKLIGNGRFTVGSHILQLYQSLLSTPAQ